MLPCKLDVIVEVQLEVIYQNDMTCFFKCVPFDLASQKDLQCRIGTPLTDKPSDHQAPLVGN